MAKEKRKGYFCPFARGACYEGNVITGAVSAEGQCRFWSTRPVPGCEALAAVQGLGVLFERRFDILNWFTAQKGG